MSGRTSHRTNGAADFGGGNSDWIKAGSVTMDAGLSAVEVTFPVPFPTGATYQAVPVFKADPGIVLGLRVASQTESGFSVIAAKAAHNAASVGWIAARET